MIDLRSLPKFLGLVATLLLVVLQNQTLAQGQSDARFGIGLPISLEDLPPGRTQDHINSLPAAAQERALQWLQRFDFPENDLEQIRIDDEGGVLYADSFEFGDPEGVEGVEGDPPSISPITSVGEAFSLHSRPGAPHTLFLDLDGHVIENTAWNTGSNTLYARAYDIDGDPNSYSQDELDRIGEIWHRIAEDLAPFDIDVTTEEPTVFDSSTGRVLITADTDETGAPMPYQNAGGVAYVGVWGYSNMQYYQPALVYYDNLGNGNPTYVSEASTHEAGHNLALSHDGTGSQSYYTGHGGGLVSWAPIMGVGYYNNVTQWSRGEYAGANNTQDDLAILNGLLGRRSDDHGDNSAGATALYVDGTGAISVTNPETDPSNSLSENKGVIEHRDDVDMFSFDAAAGPATLSVTPAWDAYYRTSRRGANLDVHAALYDESGTLLAESDPTDETDAYIAITLSGGRYYLGVSGVGNAGVPYSDYGSLGQYFIAGQISVGSVDTVAPTPNPMGFAVAPAQTGSDTITMSAVTASDASGSVEYQFQCVSGGAGCVASAWQSAKTYTPTGLDAHTAYAYVVRARDAHGNQTVASAQAAATTANSMPVADDDTGGGLENQTLAIAVLGNDFDPDGDTVSVTGAGNGANGSVSTTDSSVSYSPNPGFVGTDSFTYSITDGFGGTASAQVTVTISAAPSFPAAPSNPSAAAESNGTVTVGWLDASGNETGFEVMRETKHKKRDQWNSTTTVGTTAANATSLSDAPSAATHRYRIRAVNQAGASAWTAWVEVTASSGDGGDGGGGGSSQKCHPKRGC